MFQPSNHKVGSLTLSCAHHLVLRVKNGGRAKLTGSSAACRARAGPAGWAGTSRGPHCIPGGSRPQARRPPPLRRDTTLRTYLPCGPPISQEGDAKPRPRRRKRACVTSAPPLSPPLVASPLQLRRSALLLGGAGPVAQGTGSRQSPRPGGRPHLLPPGGADESRGAAAGGESGPRPFLGLPDPLPSPQRRPARFAPLSRSCR